MIKKNKCGLCTPPLTYQSNPESIIEYCESCKTKLQYGFISIPKEKNCTYNNG